MTGRSVNSSEAKAGKTMVPLVEGLYRLPSGPAEKGYLIGRKCQNCGAYFFPNTGHQKVVCLNCLGRDLKEVALSSKGKLYSYTITTMAPEFAVVKPPYAIGVIWLQKENLLVWAASTPDCDLKKIKIDMDVELVFEKVKEDEEGNDVMAYLFKPVQ
jgi:uncharacterized OB-fold protein